MKNETRQNKGKFHLYQHPWLAMLAVMLVSVLSIFFSGAVIFGQLGLPDDKPIVQFTQNISYHILTGFILVPFLLRLPKGRTSYKEYLVDIGFSKVSPFFRLVLLGLSCYLFLFLSQATASIVFRLFEGYPITSHFIHQVLDLTGDLPPKSASLLTSLPSIFEEVAFRGVVLTAFMNRYSERKSIIFSSLGFGLMHILNLAMGRELVWVVGQIVWAFLIGLFYGYVFIQTRSLLPSMIVHYLGNAFIGSLTAYLQTQATPAVEALYGVIFTLGLVPTALMILWARYYISRWLPMGEKSQKG
jgi:membrane protease YdiL (CAAX protease family)